MARRDRYVTEPRDSYSPERRTALLFTGTGADGAYHAGAMRALQEAGVKIDVVGGRGIGAIAAVLAAVDGGSQLWDAGGFWRSPAVARSVSLALAVHACCAGSAIALLAVLAIPAAVMLLATDRLSDRAAARHGGTRGGRAIRRRLRRRCCRAPFRRAALPTWIPRLAALLSTAALVVLGAGAWLAWWRSPLYRRSTGNRLWTLLGSPIDAGAAIEHATETVWRLLKGGASIKTPEADDLSRRYSELLAENLGQPGFRELLLVVHDLDANRDLVFGLVRDPYRRMLFPAPGGVSVITARRSAGLVERHAGISRRRARGRVERCPGVSESRLVKFAPDAYWRGETHRLRDRPGSIGRLLEEAAAAGAEQVMIVSAIAGAAGPARTAAAAARRARTRRRTDRVGRNGGAVGRGSASASSFPGRVSDPAVAQPDPAARSDRRLRRAVRSRADRSRS